MSLDFAQLTCEVVNVDVFEDQELASEVVFDQVDFVGSVSFEFFEDFVSGNLDIGFHGL